MADFPGSKGGVVLWAGNYTDQDSGAHTSSALDEASCILEFKMVGGFDHDARTLGVWLSFPAIEVGLSSGQETTLIKISSTFRLAVGARPVATSSNVIPNDHMSAAWL